MIRMNDNRPAGKRRGHVAFGISRRAASNELRVTGGLVAALIVAIGICGSVLPPRSGWLPPSSIVNTWTSLNDRSPADLRNLSQG